jgi:cell division protein FtsB
MKINIQDYQDQLNDLAGRFRDIRFTGQVVFVGIVLLISWSGIKTIQSNYQLQKEISTLNQQNEVHDLENSNLKLQNEYYNTEEYLELSARRNFGLGKPGEKELLVPQTVAYTYAADIKPQNESTIEQESKHTNNFQAWVNFFLNRPSN